MVPVNNVISIDIDAFYNTTNPNRLGTYVDWVSLNIETTRPILFVHGWNGAPSGWGTWTTELDSDDRQIPHTATSPGINRIPRIGALAVKDSILALRTRYGVDRVNIVAHSQGGLDTRYFLRSDRGRSVETFLMLGTPNGGAPIANTIFLPAVASKITATLDIKNLNVRAVGSLFSYFGLHLSPVVTGKFNDMDRGDYMNTDVYAYAGDDRAILGNYFRPFLSNADFPEFGGFNDGVVPVWSAFDLPDGYNAIYCLREDNSSTSLHINLTGEEVMNDVIDFVVRDPITHPRITEPIPDMNGTIRYNSRCEDGTKPIPSGTGPRTLARGTSTPTRQGAGGLVEMVARGETVSAPILVDGGTEVTFTIATPGERVVSGLVSPSGQRYGPTSTGNVQYADLGVTGYPIQQFVVDSPETGEWTVEATIPTTILTDSLAVSIVGELDGSNSRLDLAPASSSIASSQPLTFHATLARGGVALTGANVVAAVLLPDTTLTGIAVSDDGQGADPVAGDGVYSGTFSQTSDPGLYRVLVVAEVGGATPFTRLSQTVVAVTDGTVTAPSVSSGRTVDIDSDGLADSLVVDVSSTVSTPGTYMARASIVDASGALVTTGSTVATFAAGDITAAVAFDGRAVRRNYGAGGLRLSDVRVAKLGDEIDMPPSATAITPFPTLGYPRNVFERSVIEAFGEPSYRVADDNGDGTYDRLVVTAPTFDIQFADYYSFGLSLTDAGGKVVASAGYPAFLLQPGVYPGLEFTFDGDDIRAAGHNGPFVVKNLIVQGESLGSSLVVRSVLRTEPLLYTQFGTPVACKSSASGVWTSSATWTSCNGGVPGTGSSAAVKSDHTVEINGNIAVDSLVVESGGVVRFDGTPRTLTVSGAVRVNSGAAFGAAPPMSGEHVLTIGGDLTTDGAFDLGIRASVLHFNGGDNAVVGGMSTLRVPTLRIAKTNSAVRLAGGVDVRQRLDLAAGTLDLQGRRLALVSDTTTGAIATLARNGGTLTGGGLAFQRTYLGLESFRMVASPAASTPFSALNGTFHTQGAPWADYSLGGANFFAYDPVTQSYVVPQQDGPFERGRGYFLYVYIDEDGTAPSFVPALPLLWEVSGAEHAASGAVAVPFVNGDPSQSYSLLGNPFIAPLDWDQIGGRNGIGLTYESIDSTGAYVSYQAGGVDAGAGRYIAPFQAFWVQATALGASVDFDRASVVANGTPLVVGRSAAVPLAIRFSVVESRFGHQAPAATLVIDERANAGPDALDAAYFGPGTDVAPVAGVWFGGTDVPLAIEGRPQTGEQTANLHAVPTAPGTYTLRWEGADTLPAGWAASLLDTVTGEQTDLRSSGTYVFTSDSGVAARTFPVSGPPTLPRAPNPIGGAASVPGLRSASAEEADSRLNTGSYTAPARFRVVLSPQASSLRALAAPEVVIDHRTAMVAWRDVLSPDAQVSYTVQVARADSSGGETTWSDKGSAGVNGDGDYSVAVGGLDYGRYRVRVVRSERSGLTSVSPEASLNVAVSGTHTLGRARPNPSRGSTSISLAVAEQQRIVVEVYDLLGRRVLTAFDGEVEPDRTFDVRIDGRTLSSGTYVVRVQGTRFAETQRLTVVR